jgi:hypothetical protein
MTKDIGNYIVNSDGTVFSKHYNRLITPHFNPVTGYCQFQLGNKRVLSHRLIALTFIPNPDNLPQVNHKNRIKTDNRVDNLEWCTGSYNTLDAYASGLAKGPQGEINGNSKLNPAMILMIRERAKVKSHTKLAKELGLSQATVSRIVSRHSWKHV